MTGVQGVQNLDAVIGELSAGLEIVATRRLGNRDDARDAVQETIARLLERIRAGAIASDSEVVPIAWGIARHVIADALRARSREADVATDVAAPSPDALERLVSGEQRAAVAAGLAQLGAADRELLRRCFVDGERIGAIAIALGEPAERVRKRKSRALARLAAVLGATDAPCHETHPRTMEER